MITAGIDAFAVVDDLDHDAVGFLRGADGQLAGCRLARGQANLRSLQAVIEAVANNVNQRVGQRLDDVLVGFGLLAFEHQLNFLAEFARDVAHQAREALEDKRDRHHADLHDGVLHLVGDAVDD